MASSWKPIADAKHERHAELLEWCGGDFDPKQFDVDEINRRRAAQGHPPQGREADRRLNLLVALPDTYPSPAQSKKLSVVPSGVLNRRRSGGEPAR